MLSLCLPAHGSIGEHLGFCNVGHDRRRCGCNWRGRNPELVIHKGSEISSLRCRTQASLGIGDKSTNRPDHSALVYGYSAVSL